MTFSLAQSFCFFSPSFYNLYTLRYNSESGWPHPLSSSQKNPQKLFSEQPHCLHPAGCGSKAPASNTACSHCSYTSYLHMWVMFPQRCNQPWAQIQEKGDPAQSILLLPFHFQQLCCSTCPPGITGQLLLSWTLEMFHNLQLFPRFLACEELQPWLSMSKAAEREPGTLPLEYISHCCVRRVLDLHHSWDMYLYTFLNIFI